MTTREAAGARAPGVVVGAGLAGLTVAHVAELLEMSVGAVSEEWKIARLWLHRELVGFNDDAR